MKGKQNAVGMRRAVFLLVACCVSTGCAGPHASGALWAQRNLEQEAALFRLTDVQRAEQARAFELSLADDALSTERARITSDLQDCPGPQQALGISAGDKVRDGIRIRAQGDATRLAQVAQLSLADWQLRRARATGRSNFCDAALETLRSAAAASTTSTRRQNEVDAVVTRDPRRIAAPNDTLPSNIAISNYATGYLEVVHAPTPLPEYLAAVYGGYLYLNGGGPALAEDNAADQVDRQASANPEWEPDALYAALRAGSW